MSEVLIYETEGGQTRVDVRLEAETVWLSLGQMTDLFGRDKSVISRHLRNIFQDGELVRDSVVALIATTAADGKTYQVDYFNLDTIISVGYRVNSAQATRFRQWATRTLREHLVQGYTLNQSRLAERGISEAQQAIELLARRRLVVAQGAGLLPQGVERHAGLQEIFRLGYRGQLLQRRHDPIERIVLLGLAFLSKYASANRQGRWKLT